MRLKAVLLTMFCFVAPPLAHADWPEWRGPSQQGLTDAKLPLHWSETEPTARDRQETSHESAE